MNSPLTPLLERQPVMILDGGLATELERRGEDLNDPLWSAKVLLERPKVIRDVHMDYLRAGADCIASASYQATFEGLERRGLSHADAERLLRSSVDLAREARDRFWTEAEGTDDRQRPLVAASVGPYGAFLADGSEYSGDYGLSVAELSRFHRERLEILASAGADIVACETIPSRSEALSLTDLLDRFAVPAWISFSCQDEQRICDDTLLARVLGEIDSCEAVVAVGINCTAPQHVSGLLRSVQGATTKPLMAYPNSGESWDAEAKEWGAEPSSVELSEAARVWHRLGAVVLGGCCRTSPADIARLRQAIL